MPALLASDCTPVRRLPLMTGQGSLLSLFSARFSAANFTPDQFGRAAIDCPPEVVRSVRKRQAEYFHGRLCARAALAALGLDDCPVPTGRSREPVWPDGVIGSITHSRDMAAAVALKTGRYGGVGIDIEHVIDEQSRAALVKMAVSSAEFDYLAAAAGPLSLNHLLTMVFSAKESFFKASFPLVGHYFDFSAISVTRVDAEARAIWFVVNTTLCPDIVEGAPYQASYLMLDDHTVLTALLR